MGSTPAFLLGCAGRGPLAAGGETPDAAAAAGGRLLSSSRLQGRCPLCASHTTESVRGRVSRVRSRISRAHDLTAWNASALGQRARPTG